MEKMFKVGGYSTLPNGVKKVRAANDLADRVKKLSANGHTDIFLEELPVPMTKEQIAERYGMTHKSAATKKVKAEPVAEVQQTETTAEADEGEDTVRWLKPGEQPTHSITFATFEEALAAVPLREKGRFLSKEVREQRAKELFETAPV